MASTTSDIPTLWLLPAAMSDGPLDRVLPPWNLEVMGALRHFVVENVRTARRFLRRAIPGFDIDGSSFEVLDKSTPSDAVASLAQPLEQGHDLGLMSEAGCPAVADPGAALVAVAQRRGWRVMPLVGPSSILMSLMASGFNGQHFTFAGYLPIDSRQRAEALRRMEREAARGCTQIFIETPYRNARLLAELAAGLPPELLLCVAADITGPRQAIVTRPAAQWRRADTSFCDKVPAIFLIGRNN